jgi:hypothetical protein
VNPPEQAPVTQDVEVPANGLRRYPELVGQRFHLASPLAANLRQQGLLPLVDAHFIQVCRHVTGVLSKKMGAATRQPAPG